MSEERQDMHGSCGSHGRDYKRYESKWWQQEWEGERVMKNSWRFGNLL